MTAPVYVARLDSVRVGGTLRLEGAEGHHAATVRRTRPGERIDVVDGVGTRACCEVTESRKGAVTLIVVKVAHEPAPSTPVTLVQALAKGGRDEQAVETATEYGVDELVPWCSQRAIVSWRGKETKGRDRWQATARAAAKQSRRSWIPGVRDVHSSPQLMTMLKEARAGGARVYVCHEEAIITLADELRLRDRGQDEKDCPRVYVVVGPEGGISPEELDDLVALGARMVLLAPHVLRSASAGPWAIATLAAVQ